MVFYFCSCLDRPDRKLFKIAMNSYISVHLYFLAFCVEKCNCLGAPVFRDKIGIFVPVEASIYRSNRFTSLFAANLPNLFVKMLTVALLRLRF